MHKTSRCSIVLFFAIQQIILATDVENIRQLQIDSLGNKSYNELIESISIHYTKNPKNAIIYTKAYLNKAKKDNDNEKIIESYFYMSELYKNHETAIIYIDSAITLNTTKNINYLLAPIYNQKGKLYYSNGDYKKALDNFIRSKEFAKKFENQLFISNLNHNIGLIKLHIGDIQEALKIFKKSYAYILNNLKENTSTDYLNILEALSYAYWRNKELDSAQLFNNKEFNESQFYKSDYHYNRAKIIAAFIDYENKKFGQTIDSINKYTPLLEKELDSLDLALIYLYKGKSYQKLNNWKNALPQYKKVDTIISNNNRYTIELRESLHTLYNYYKSINKPDLQLIYSEKLIDFDRILYEGNTKIRSDLALKFDTQELIKEREHLIKQFKKQHLKKSNLFYWLLSAIFLLISTTFYFYFKRLGYKKSYKKVIENYNSLLAENNIGKNDKAQKSLNVPNTIAKDILEKIQTFEDNKLFLKNTISLQGLAKSFGTNNNYLSRVINFYKNKNFSTYLSDLRIHYTIKVLKEDTKLRKYTIKAIAHEVGFKNSESFTKAFYKRTKIYPSFYIKQLKKES